MARKKTPAPDPEPAPAALAVRRVPVAALHADPANVNTHDALNLRTIRDSWQEFGQVEPLVVQKGTGKVIGGNGRLEVIRDLAVEEVDVVELEIGDVRATALGIALNRTAKTSAFDETALAQVLRSLQSEDFPIEAAGFTGGELDDLIEGLGSGLLDGEGGGSTEPDPGPQMDRADELLVKWGVEPGQLWEIPSHSLLGRSHRLLCGDSTNAEDVARLMGGDPFALVVTDPPYGVDFVRGQYISDPSRRGKSSAPASIKGDDLKGDRQRDFVRESFAILRTHADDAASVYMFSACLVEGCCSFFGLIEAGVKVQSQLIWNKNHLCLGQADYQWKHEVIWYGWYEGSSHRWYGERDKVTVLDFARVQATLHPNEKPLELIAFLVGNSSLPGDILAEPFAGSGTCLVAAEKTGRLSRAMELDPKFVACSLERLSGMGLVPRRAN